MSPWTNCERFCMDFMNISLALLALGMLAVVLGTAYWSLFRRERGGPIGRWFGRSSKNALSLPDGVAEGQPRVRP